MINKENNNMDMMGVFMNFMKKFDENQVAISKTNQDITLTLDGMAGKLMNHDSLIKVLSGKVDDSVVRVARVEDEILKIKENERIDEIQRGEITNRAFSRICDFLEHNTEEWHKYSKTYFFDLYRHLRQNCYLRKPMALTRNKDFDTVMSGFDSWYPNELELKEKADKSARNRAKAKSMGY